MDCTTPDKNSVTVCPVRHAGEAKSGSVKQSGVAGEESIFKLASPLPMLQNVLLAGNQASLPPPPPHATECGVPQGVFWQGNMKWTRVSGNMRYFPLLLL